jgi:hypothetical protein
MDAMTPIGEIGGGVVRRRFTYGSENMTTGRTLSPEQIAGMANRRTLIRNGNIEIYPRAPDETLIAANIGVGKYVVVRGSEISPRGLTKEEAMAFIAARKAPAKTDAPAADPVE